MTTGSLCPKLFEARWGTGGGEARVKPGIASACALPGAVASNLELPVRQFITAGSAGHAFVVLRTRRAGSAVFERVSLVLENGRWMVAGWIISPAPSA